MGTQWEIIAPESSTNFARNPVAGITGNASVYYGPERFGNTGFETPGAGGLDLWASWGETYGDGAIADEGSLVYAGSHAAKLTGGATPADFPETFQILAVVAGTYYRLQLRSRGDGTNGGRYYVYDNTNLAFIIPTTETGLTGTSYVQLTDYFTVPAGCTEIIAGVRCPNVNGGICYYDDVSLTAEPTLSRSSTYHYRGVYSWRVETASDGEGAQFTLAALSLAAHYASMQVAGTLPTAWQWSVDGADWTAPTLLDTDGDWSYYGASFAAGQCSGSSRLYVRQSGAGSGDFYLDAIQVEQKAGYATTLCTGDEEGCTWNGTPHASSSTRSAMSAAGGRAMNIDDNYGVVTTIKSGYGMAPIRHNVQRQALMPGARLQGKKVEPRPFVLGLVAKGDDAADFHDRRMNLIDIFRPDRVTPDQPVRMRYKGAQRNTEFDADYDTGLGGEEITGDAERLALRGIAYDPYFYEFAHGAASVTAKQTLTGTSYILRKNDGAWSRLPGLNNSVFATVVAADGTIYAAGQFTNASGDANADYVAKWNGSIWEPLGTGANGDVLALAIGIDGSLYAAGGFTQMGGVANTAYIAKWDGSAWSALGTGMDAACRALAIGLDGTLYAGGDFTTAGGNAASGIAKWDGSAWSALGTGLASGVVIRNAMAIGIDGALYIGGTFTTVGGVAVNHIAKWDGSAWSALGTGTNGTYVSAIAVRASGSLYAAGDFTTAGGTSANRIAEWNGASWSALGTGLNGIVNGLSIAADGLLYVGGTFTTAGGLSTAQRLATWNGSTWSHIDVLLPGTPTVDTVRTSSDGQQIFLGFTTAGTATTSALTTVNNSGSAKAYPRIKVRRVGGTTATIQWIKNETTGRLLKINYALQNKETLVIDLDYRRDATKPESLKKPRKYVYSDYYGDVVGRTLLPDSDLGSWALLPGNNDVTVYVSDSGSPTIEVEMEWRIPRISTDVAT